ncbi:MAG: hypothetical protein CVU03_03620 [Bacteroidetes bacterium HGW-Bacteroidetes-2]|jgi:tetratricopeptide (TPR) repeat protein|nr:MAG: hypothetical protein CVU03_03620 [Bacteroidetes bacterium HGW-Bacteroidetes-2]
MSFSQKKYDIIINEANPNVYENPNKAIKIGLEIYNASDSSLENKVEALMLISTAYSSKRIYEKSLEFANNALELLPNIKNNSFKIKILNKIGSQYQQLKIYDKAISYLDKALQIANEEKNKDSILNLLGYNYGARGFIYREQMSCEIALNYFNKALYFFYKNLENDPIMNANISIITYNKGNCFLATFNIDSARINFNNAIYFAKFIDAKSLQAFAQKGLAEVYTSEGLFTKAITILNEARVNSSDVEDLVLNQGIYKGLSNNYLALGDWSNYQHFKKKYEETIQEIKNTETTTINNSLANLLEEFDAETKQLAAKNQYALLVIILVILFFFILISKALYVYRKKLNGLKKVFPKNSTT